MAFFIALAALVFADGAVADAFSADRPSVPALFVAALAIAILGVYDDVRGADARTKFTVQFAVGGFMYWAGFRIDQIATPFGDPFSLGVFGLPVTVIWIAGVINALNLIDGLDGLAGGIALLNVATLLVFALASGDTLIVPIACAMAGAIVGFLRYNFNPARIFMGDTGSMFLGFLLATSAIRAHQESATAVALLVPIVALGVPLADTTLAMLRRAIGGLPLFQADRGHIHHRLLALGLSHRAAVLVLYAAATLCCTASVALAHATSTQAVLILFALGTASFVALRGLGFFRLSEARAMLDERRRNVALRLAIGRVVERIETAAHVEDIWAHVRSAASLVGAQCVGLRLVGMGARDHSVAEFRDGFDGAGPELFRTRHCVTSPHCQSGTLELGWTDGRHAIDPSTEMAVEVVCEHMLHAIGRIATANGHANGHQRTVSITASTAARPRRSLTVLQTAPVSSTGATRPGVGNGNGVSTVNALAGALGRATRSSSPAEPLRQHAPAGPAPDQPPS